MRAYQRYINRLKDTANQAIANLKKEVRYLEDKNYRLTVSNNSLSHCASHQEMQIKNLHHQIAHLERTNKQLREEVALLKGSTMPF